MVDSQLSHEFIPQELIQLQKSGGYIRLFTRAGNLYGSCYGPHHIIDNKSQRIECYLGKVIDSQNNIFHNKRWGYFQFTIEGGYISKNDKYQQNIDHNQNILNLRYGSIWLLNDIYQKTKFDYVLDNVLPYHSDTLYTLLAYKLTTRDNSFVNVSNWYQRSYARILYPNAAVSSGSISNYLQEIGQSNIREIFFDFYHDYLKEDKESDVLICNSVLLDSTGAQNSIKIPLTAVSNHNGVVNNEFRVIYVVDHDRNLPVYMNQIPGNVVDVSTLKYMVHLLQMRKIFVNCFVLDAGYYSDDNINYLDTNKFKFLIRMCNNRKIYKDLIDYKSLDLSSNPKYRIFYRNRFLHCKKRNFKNWLCHALCIYYP